MFHTNLVFTKTQAPLNYIHKKTDIQIVATFLTIVMKRKIQQEACKLGYNQKCAMLQYFICNKNAIKVKNAIMLPEQGLRS